MPDRQFYGAIIWYHLMAPFYGMCVPGIRQFTARTTTVIHVYILLAVEGGSIEPVTSRIPSLRTCWASDLAVVGSIPGRGVMRAPMSTQPSIPPG